METLFVLLALNFGVLVASSPINGDGSDSDVHSGTLQLSEGQETHRYIFDMKNLRKEDEISTAKQARFDNSSNEEIFEKLVAAFALPSTPEKGNPDKNIPPASVQVTLVDVFDSSHLKPLTNQPVVSLSSTPVKDQESLPSAGSVLPQNVEPGIVQMTHSDIFNSPQLQKTNENRKSAPKDKNLSPHSALKRQSPQDINEYFDFIAEKMIMKVRENLASSTPTETFSIGVRYFESLFPAVKRDQSPAIDDMRIVVKANDGVSETVVSNQGIKEFQSKLIELLRESVNRRRNSNAIATKIVELLTTKDENPVDSKEVKNAGAPIRKQVPRSSNENEEVTLLGMGRIMKDGNVKVRIGRRKTINVDIPFKFEPMKITSLTRSDQIPDVEFTLKGILMISLNEVNGSAVELNVDHVRFLGPEVKDFKFANDALSAGTKRIISKSVKGYFQKLKYSLVLKKAFHDAISTPEVLETFTTNQHFIQFKQ